jgi:hypothetical protein
MVDAIASVATKAASSTNSLGAAADFSSTASAGSSHASAGGGLADAFQNAVSTLKTHDTALGATGAAHDPVAAAKAQMQPADAKSLIADTTPKIDVKSGNANGLGALEKSFDHAVFVSLVSQVVGGVSQATTTLVKQS